MHQNTQSKIEKHIFNETMKATMPNTIATKALEKSEKTIAPKNIQPIVIIIDMINVNKYLIDSNIAGTPAFLQQQLQFQETSGCRHIIILILNNIIPKILILFNSFLLLFP